VNHRDHPPAMVLACYRESLTRWARERSHAAHQRRTPHARARNRCLVEGRPAEASILAQDSELLNSTHRKADHPKKERQQRAKDKITDVRRSVYFELTPVSWRSLRGGDVWQRPSGLLHCDPRVAAARS